MTMTNQKIQATEYLVGQNHATLADTLNRLAVGLNTFRLIKSGSNLTLEAVGGNLVDINGNVYAVTSIPTLAPTSLSPDTLYYIYLYSNSGTATLEASTTGFTVDSKGRANKTGDATRRLMGMAYCVTGPAWSTNPLLVASYDNRRTRTSSSAFTANRSTASTSYVELNSEIRVPFLSWDGEYTRIHACGGTQGTSTGEHAHTAIGIDGTTAEDAYCQAYVSSSGSQPFGLTLGKNAAAGYHYATLLGKIGNNSVNWIGSATAGARCTLTVVTRG